ncbi:MAG: SpoIIE family protein phosphatase [Armatimonadetes bacterium]|nr:SpoIIE family protein phosphatase [Armatimonadota bacterium]
MATPKRRSLPLHLRLAILCAGAALLLAAGLVLVVARHTADEARQQMLSSLQSSARIGALQMAQVLLQVEQEGRSLLRAAPAGNPAHLRQALAALLRHDDRLAGAVVRRPGGGILLAVPSHAAGAVPRGEPETPPLSVGRPLPAGSDRPGTVPITLYGSGASEGRALVLLLRRDALQHALAMTAAIDVEVQLLDLRAAGNQPPRGPLHAERLAGRRAAAAVTPCRPQPSGLVAAVRVARAPWAVLAQTPNASVAEAARRTVGHLLPWAGLAILLAAGAGVATALWVSLPLRRLTASVEHMARGTLTEPTGIHRGDEVGQLAAAFDLMADELRRRWDDNRELYERERRRARLLQALEEVAHAVNSTLSLDQVLETIVRRGSQLIGVQAWAITLVDERGELRLRYASGFSDEFRARLPGLLVTDRAARRALREQRVITIHDPAAESEAPEVWRSEGIVALACAPMTLEGEVIGSLDTYSKEQAVFTDEQLQTLAALAAQAATALHNARLFEESERKTREVQSSFRRIGAALASGLRLDDTLALIAELACEMLHADACLIRLLDESSGELAVRATYGLAAGELARTHLRAGEGLGGHVAYAATPIAVADLTKDRRTVGVPPGSGIRAYLGVPLHAKSRPIGVLAVFKRRPYQFAKEEVDLLSSFGAQASVALENRRLYEQESQIAHTLQRSLLPMVPRALRGMALGELYLPSRQEMDVGGDFYDLFSLEHGRVGVVMGDVCGKGLRAAVYTAMAKYAIRSYALDNLTPVEVMRKTNRALCRQITDDSLFVSMVYAVVDVPGMSLSLASAGHPPPVHLARARGTTRFIEAEGPLAGLLPYARYAEARVALSPGDILFLYTDGITEARRDGDVWGADALGCSVAAHAALSAPELVRAVYADAERFAGDALRDDVALLAIKVLGPEGE